MCILYQSTLNGTLWLNGDFWEVFIQNGPGLLQFWIALLSGSASQQVNYCINFDWLICSNSESKINEQYKFLSLSFRANSTNLLPKRQTLFFPQLVSNCWCFGDDCFEQARFSGENCWYNVFAVSKTVWEVDLFDMHMMHHSFPQGLFAIYLLRSLHIF